MLVHPLPGDPPICKSLAIPKHPTGPSELSTMTNNPANLAPKDQFLLWRQELEARQEEQARQMAELCVQANQLREENERMRTQLEVGRADPSVLQGIGYGENPAGINDLRHQLPNMCLTGQGASLRQSHPSTRHTGPPPRRK